MVEPIFTSKELSEIIRLAEKYECKKQITIDNVFKQYHNLKSIYPDKTHDFYFNTAVKDIDYSYSITEDWF